MFAPPGTIQLTLMFKEVVITQIDEYLWWMWMFWTGTMSVVSWALDFFQRENFTRYADGLGLVKTHGWETIITTFTLK